MANSKGERPDERAFDYMPDPPTGEGKKELSETEQQIAKLRALARDAKEVGNWSLAAKYFGEIDGLSGDGSPKDVKKSAEGGAGAASYEALPVGSGGETAPNSERVGDIGEKGVGAVKAVAAEGERRIQAAEGTQEQVGKARSAGADAVAAAEGVAGRLREKAAGTNAAGSATEKSSGDPRSLQAKLDAARERARQTGADADWGEVAHLNNVLSGRIKNVPVERSKEGGAPKPLATQEAPAPLASEAVAPKVAAGEHAQKEGVHNEPLAHVEEKDIKEPEREHSDIEKAVKADFEKIGADSAFDFKSLEDPQKLSEFLRLGSDASPEERLRRVRVAFDAAAEKIGFEKNPERYADMQRAIEIGNRALEAGKIGKKTEAAPEEDRPATLATEEPAQEGVPVMITKDMEQQLSDLGWKADARGSLTPQEAWEIIKGERTYSLLDLNDSNESSTSADKEPERAPQDKQESTVPPEQASAGLESEPALSPRAARAKEELSEALSPEARGNLSKEIGEKAYEGLKKAYVESRYQSQKAWEELRRTLVAPARNMVDRVRLMWNEKFFARHDDRAQSAYLDVAGLNENIAREEAKLRTYDADWAAVKAKLGGVDSGKANSAAAAEKRELAAKIDKMKAERRRAQSKLESQNRAKASFENNRKKIAREYTERLKDQLEPYEKQISETRGTRDQYDKEIQAFTTVQNRHGAELRELEAGLKASWSKADQLAYKAAIVESKGALKTVRKALALRFVERAKVEKKLASLEDRTSPWRDKMNELAILSRREEVYKNPGTKFEVQPDWTERRIEPAPVAGEAPGESNPETSPSAPGAPSLENVSREASAPEAPRTPERTEKRWDTRAFVNRWNNLFASELKIDARVLFGRMGVSPEPKSFANQEKMVTAYWRAASEARRTRLGERKLRQNLKMLRSVLENEARS